LPTSCLRLWSCRTIPKFVLLSIIHELCYTAAQPKLWIDVVTHQRQILTYAGRILTILKTTFS
jgi:hypothetical protein